MDACDPAGLNFHATRQFGCRYAFIRDVALEVYEHTYHEWDPDQTILAAFTLSRFIVDHAISTEYAARVVDRHDGRRRIIPGPVNREGALAYRASTGRDWLTSDDAMALTRLLDAYWSAHETLPARASNAIWLAEQSARRRYDFEVLTTVVSGLEALTNTGPHQNTKQFRERVPRVAAAVGVQISNGAVRRVYDRRHEPVHGRALRLVSARADEPSDAFDDRYQHALSDLAAAQLTLRSACRKIVEDTSFRHHFADDASVRAQWPVVDGEGNEL
jgi:hypothetical protein